MIKGIIIMNTLKLLEWNTFSSIKIKKDKGHSKIYLCCS